MVRVVSAVVAEWRTENSRFDNDRRLKDPCSNGSSQQMGASPRGKVLLN